MSSAGRHCNTQASGEHGEVQVLVGLEGLAEEGADQVRHLCVIPSLIGLVQGRVVLVNQDRRPAAIVFAKQF